MSNRWTKLIAAGACSAVMVLVAVMAYPYFELHLRIRRLVREAPYVVVHSFQDKATVTIRDEAINRQLWNAVDVVSRTQASGSAIRTCESEANPCLAYAAFPLPGARPGDMEFPIYAYRDGTALWGLPPQDRKYFCMPRYRDALMVIVEDRIRHRGTTAPLQPTAETPTAGR